MKNRVRHLPIQRKLRLVVLVTCTAALCVASSALFALQFYFFQRDFRRDLVAVAEIVAANSTAALRFKDANAAQQNLASLKAKPQIVGAALVLADGRTLAHAGRVIIPGPGEFLPTAAFYDRPDGLIYIRPVRLADDLLGAILLHAESTAEARELYKLYASILIGVLTTSFLVAVLVSWRLERLILGPIQNLAQTARHIASENDYSIRASKVTDDEVGSFTDSFNSMLDQIQARDTVLLYEIAERQRTEENLQRTQAELIDASRQAGMAEVATGVLHNVGNVLNSVNVSATILAERLHESRTPNLVRAAAMLREPNGQLTEFLTNDPKGQLLPAYISDLSEHLEKERMAARSEVDLLTRNIEHLKDIVAMQQTYARSSSFTEALPAASLIEEALQLNRASFTRQHIVVERKLAPVPPVAVDRHRALQILINLLRNAQQAMADLEPGQRHLFIRLWQADSATAVIEVSDCGGGIAPENLTRIFAHGFTTRREGHGFGLHSAALAAQQMGGRLTASSDGLGCGATFTFELPLSEPPTA